MTSGAIAARADRLWRSAGAAITGMVVPFLTGAAADLCVLAGVGTIAYGIALLWRPVAFIFLGVVAIVIGLRGLSPPAPPAAGGEVA